jgi:hypothetical protein
MDKVSVAWRLVCAAAFAVLVAAGCGGGGASVSGWSPEIQARIDAASTAVSQAVAGESDFGSEAGRNRVQQKVKAIPGVEDAGTSPDGSFFVKYAEGGMELWLRDTPNTPPPDRSPLTQIELNEDAAGLRVSVGRGPIGNYKAVILNSVNDDPAFARQARVLDDVKTLLEARGFSVERKDGTWVSPESLSDLSQYALVIYFGHGGFGPAVRGGADEYCMQTGVKWDNWTDPQERHSKWAEGSVIRVQVNWGTVNRDKHRELFAAVTGRFWATAYKSRHFSNALFLNGTCDGSKDSAFIATMRSIGISGYAGWTEETSLGADGSYGLVARMAVGKEFRTAFDDLPAEYRTWSYARLWPMPPLVVSRLQWDGDGTLTLGVNGQYTSHLTIYRPINNSVTTERVISIGGQVDSYQTSWNLSMEISNVLTRVDVQSDGSFSAISVLRPGDNVLTFRLDTNEGREVQVFHVTGDFALQQLWSELRWNTDGTDIDLHLVPVGASPWSIQDCYYANKQASWGASLDVDDVNGYGPEHITGNAIAGGKYLLFVHCFSTNGSTAPTTPSVILALQGGENRIFTCPQPMTQADNVWNIGYITYPGGQFELLNEFVPVGRSRRPIPQKH